MLKKNISIVDIEYIDPTNGRNALMVCGLDPQNATTIDEDCKEIASLIFQYNGMEKYKITVSDYRNWNALSMGAIRGLTNYCSYILDYVIQMNIDGNIDNSEYFYIHNHDLHEKTLDASIRSNDTNTIPQMVNFTQRIIDMCNMRDMNKGRTPLLHAAVNGHMETVLMFLKYSGGKHFNCVDMYVRDDDGLSVLHFLTLKIISRGTKHVRTPQDLSIYRHLLNEIINLDIANVCNSGSMSNLIAVNEGANMVDSAEKVTKILAVPLHCDSAMKSNSRSILNVLDNSNRNILMYAAMSLDVEVVEIILDMYTTLASGDNMCNAEGLNLTSQNNLDRGRNVYCVGYSLQQHDMYNTTLMQMASRSAVISEMLVTTNVDIITLEHAAWNKQRDLLLDTETIENIASEEHDEF